MAQSKKDQKAPKVSKASKKNPFARAFHASIEYFKGAWYELRQVRWPSRKATWSLSVAVIIFSGLFVAIIMLLDLLFKYLFEVLLK